MDDTPRIKRLQHPDFGHEIRALLGTENKEDRKLAGILTSEINHLAACRAAGRRHPDEDSLKGPLNDIDYLRLYRANHSLRVYFVVIRNVLWMLLLDVSKRQTKLSEGTEKRLKDRLRDARERAKALHEEELKRLHDQTKRLLP